MTSVKFSVHPLFFIFGFYYALTGKILLFVIYTLSALLHETGHSVKASKEGYRLSEIVLMPFGAVVKGDIEGASNLAQVKIALAGPITNLIIGLTCVAMWWIFPLTYPYTDIIADANFSLAIINFIPAYPLDGGRILFFTLCNKFSKKTADNVCKVMGLTLGTALLGLFVYSCFKKVNVSLLFFSLFVIFGTLEKRSGIKYLALYSPLSNERLKNGLEIKKIAVSSSTTVKRLIQILDESYVNEITVYDNGKKVADLSQEKLRKVIESGKFYSKIGEFLP